MQLQKITKLPFMASWWLCVYYFSVYRIVSGYFNEKWLYKVKNWMIMR
jgi:hypothetical protein